MDETDTILAVNHKHRIANIPKKANSYSKIIYMYKWTDEPEQEILQFLKLQFSWKKLTAAQLFRRLTKSVTSAFQSIKWFQVDW